VEKTKFGSNWHCDCAEDQVWFQLTLWLCRRPSLVLIDPITGSIGTKLDLLHNHSVNWNQTWSSPQSQGQLEPNLVFSTITGSIRTNLGLPCEFWEEQVWFQLLTLWFWRRPSLVPIDPVIVEKTKCGSNWPCDCGEDQVWFQLTLNVNWNQTWSFPRSQGQLEPKMVFSKIPWSIVRTKLGHQTKFGSNWPCDCAEEQVWFQLTLWLWRRPSLVPIDIVIVQKTKFGSNWPCDFAEDQGWF
jgi:hypothetical protein